jgi:PAS domain S-box-containing protein
MLARVIEQLPHAMFVKDKSFRYVLVNSALVDMTLLTRDAILGKTDYDFLPKEYADAYRQKDIEVFSSSAGVNVAEELYVDPSGTRRVLSTRKVPLRAANGEITHVIGVLSDITRMKEIEDNLEHRVAAAQQDLMRKERLAVLGRLAGGVAHQIRNPLGAIKNAAYVLQKRMRADETLFSGPRDDEAAQALAIIHDEIHRANQIITGLLDYARVRVPVRQPARIADVIERALAHESVPSSIVVDRRWPELPPIALDADQLEGALFNLLRNAIEAMPHGGTLTIDGELHDGCVLVRICDTGEGISDDVRDRLFEPLITTKPLGLGLGLVTARTLIEGQGGTLKLTRAKPACFEVCLPRE